MSALHPAVDLHAKPSANFAVKLAITKNLLSSASVEFVAPGTQADVNASPLVTQASSLGAEDMVLSHIVQGLHLNIGIFVLETGMLHVETLALLKQLQASSKTPVEVFYPEAEAVVQFVSREGKDAMYKSIALRKACCGIRKMEPLERALKGKKAWITGLRREQSGTRADVPLRDESELAQGKPVKFNPLADWTWGDVWHYIKLHNVAYNPLHDQFYPSIGCAPCTRAISLGEDFRSGRWWWEDEAAKECGLHAKEPSLTSSLTSSPLRVRAEPVEAPSPTNKALRQAQGERSFA